MNTFIDLLSTYGLILGLPLLFLAIAARFYRSSTMERYINKGDIPFFVDKKRTSPRQKYSPRPSGL